MTNNDTHPNAVLFEGVLKGLRQSVETANIPGQIWFTPSHTLSDFKLDHVVLEGETGFEFNRLVRNGTDAARLQWIRVFTEDRLSWGRLVPEFLNSLVGLHVSVGSDTSWRWDFRNPRANGRPTYIPRYGFLVTSSSQAYTQLKADRMKESVLSGHCMAEHPLADKHLFDWLEEEGQAGLFNQYTWTPAGFCAVFETKAKVEQAQETVLKNLPHEVSRRNRFNNEKYWAVSVHLTQAEASTNEAESPLSNLCGSVAVKEV